LNCLTGRKGYAKDTLAKGSALTDISKNPYQQYGGERIAGFQPLQQRTFETAELRCSHPNK
jgi:hypothetical protein